MRKLLISAVLTIGVAGGLLFAFTSSASAQTAGVPRSDCATRTTAGNYDAATSNGCTDEARLIDISEVGNQVKDVALEQSSSFIAIITDLLPYMIALVVAVGLIFGVYRFLKGLVMRIGRG